jgi:amidase
MEQNPRRPISSTAVALATRMLAVADGSDFMGSLRNPAAWNDVFGLRPSQGRVPMWPAQDVWVTQLGTEGPMGRTVLDVALLLDVQAGYDVRAPVSLDDGEQFAESLSDFDAKKVRVGWLGNLSGYRRYGRSMRTSAGRPRSPAGQWTHTTAGWKW